jgi:hypothetical protein
MQLTITPKKQFTDYTESEQQAILSRGQAILSQKLEQGESRSLEDTWCMLVYQRTQREVKFKPTVEKILKEKPLTKAQKLKILELYVAGGSLEEEASDVQLKVLDELVGKDKEYWLFTRFDESKELMKMTKTNVKKQVKFLENELAEGKLIDLQKGFATKWITESEQEFLTAMTE